MNYSTIDYKSFLAVHSQAHEVALFDSDDEFESFKYREAFVASFKGHLKSSQTDIANDLLSKLKVDSDAHGKVSGFSEIWAFEYGWLKGFIKQCVFSVENSHGGSRTGAGRKKEQPTKQIRVDFTLANQLKDLSDLFRSQSISDQNDLLKSLTDVYQSHSGNSVS